MKPPRFEYFDPASIPETVELLKEYGDEAKVLAGGQSLVPLMNFRLLRPRYIIDLNRIMSLSYIREWNGGVAVGAMTRQREVEKSELVKARVPLLYDALPLIGHTQVRNRGTIGGSLAHADPAAELPAVALALGATLVVRGPAGERVVGAAGFFVTYLTTSLRPEELLVEIRVPARRPGSGSAFLEVSRRHGDFALVGVATTVTLDGDGVCTDAALVVTGVGPVPIGVEGAVRALVGESHTAAVLAEASRRVQEAVTPNSDVHASAEYRKHIAGVLGGRALSLAMARAKGERA